jgi:hypothetical protein
VARDEADVRFRPTYKYDVGGKSLDLDSSDKQRTPAWCDRVLWRTGEQLPSVPRTVVAPLLYTSCQSVVTSDHKPIAFLCALRYASRSK